jgi:hypothetical protein
MKSYPKSSDSSDVPDPDGKCYSTEVHAQVPIYGLDFLAPEAPEKLYSSSFSYLLAGYLSLIARPGDQSAIWKLICSPKANSNLQLLHAKGSSIMHASRLF